MFDNIKADLARCDRKTEILTNPALWAVLSYRFNRWIFRSGFPTILRLPLRFVGIVVDVMVRLVLHVELPATADIGPGLYLPHTGPVVIGTTARIGKNCTLAHNVTLGRTRSTKLREGGIASIGDRVFIGPGVTIIGPVEIGDDVLVAAGAVVMESVPSAGVIGGNPARLLSRKGAFDWISYPDMATDPARNAALAASRTG